VVQLSTNIENKSDNWIYAKVVEFYPEEPSIFRLNVTSASKLRIENGKCKIIN
jgi:hypothetical protein